MVAGKLGEVSGYYTGEEQDRRNKRGAEMIIMIHSLDCEFKLVPEHGEELDLG